MCTLNVKMNFRGKNNMSAVFKNPDMLCSKRERKKSESEKERCAV